MSDLSEKEKLELIRGLVRDESEFDGVYDDRDYRLEIIASVAMADAETARGFAKKLELQFLNYDASDSDDDINADRPNLGKFAGENGEEIFSTFHTHNRQPIPHNPAAKGCRLIEDMPWWDLFETVDSPRPSEALREARKRWAEGGQTGWT